LGDFIYVFFSYCVPTNFLFTGVQRQQLICRPGDIAARSDAQVKNKDVLLSTDSRNL